MSLFFKIQIKTGLLFLMFILIGLSSKGIQLLTIGLRGHSAVACAASNIAADFSISDTIGERLADTIPNAGLFALPDVYSNEKIDFQINSAIRYRSFGHFTGNESLKLFFQAWIIEKELEKMTEETNALRKKYSEVEPDQKEMIAVQILNAEKQMIVNHDKMEMLFQKAREQENLFWLKATADQIRKFQERVQAFNDSIRRASEHEARLKEISVDTLYIPQPPALEPERKTSEASDITYKILIGSFKGKIPEASNKLIKKLSLIRKVENYVDENGYKIYTTGSLNSFEEAVSLQKQVIQEGIKNASVIGFSKGKRITENKN